MVQITNVKPLSNYMLDLTFDDGVTGKVDLSHLADKPVFKIWQDYQVFQSVYISKETGALTWNDEVDIDTFNLYCEITKINPENNLNA